MKIDRFGIYNPLLTLEQGQSPEEIWHFIENNNLNGLSVVSNRFSPLSIEALKILHETVFIKNLNWSVYDNIGKYDFDFLYKYIALEKLYIENAPLGKIDVGLLPKTLKEFRTHWNENVLITKDNNSIESATILSFREYDCSLLSKLKALKYLSLKCNNKIESLAGLEELPYLKSLGICASIKSLKVIGELKKLTNLAFHKFELNNIDEISNLTNLKTLSFSASDISDISAIANLKKIEAISIVGCNNLTDFSAIGELSDLKFLEIEDCKNLKSINFISKLPNLKQLTLDGTTVVNDFDLKPAENIERVYIQNNLKQYNIDLRHKSIIEEKQSIYNYIS